MNRHLRDASHEFPTSLLLALPLALLGLTACDDEPAVSSVPRAPADALPATVAVPAGEVRIGIFREKRRWEASVASFSISKHPITSAQYQQCVDAGVCGPPSFDVLNCPAGVAPAAQGADESSFPRTCVSPEQAGQYCVWIGGALPTPEQWFAAARGPGVTRFAWGNEEPTCEQHWLSGPDESDLRCEGELGTAAVGRHPAGASPSGVEDVLTQWAEFVSDAPESGWLGCRNARACVVASVNPGSIDRVTAVGAKTEGKEDSAIPAAAFRCVVAGGA